MNRIFSKCIPDSFINGAFNFALRVKTSEKHQTEYVSTFTSFSDVVKYQSVKNTMYHAFEDRMYRIPVGYDEVLKWKFGDYMILPPEEERKGKHNIIKMYKYE